MHPRMAAEPPGIHAIAETMKRTAAALREAGVPFALGGSLAFWARGGPETAHDLDVIVRREDADTALAALADAGMRPERPPEGWLYKAWDGDVLVDLIWELSGLGEVEEALDRAAECTVAAVPVSVLALEDAMVSKLLALDEHHLDLEPSLRIARAVREQLDWREVRARTADSPFAAAFLFLLERLGVISAEAPAEGRAGPVVARATPIGAGPPGDAAA
jgi:hypothetical protein